MQQEVTELKAENILFVDLVIWLCIRDPVIVLLITKSVKDVMFYTKSC